MGQNSFILNDNFGIGVSSPSAAISKLTIGSGTNTYPTTPSVALGAEITLNSISLARLVMNDGSGNFQQYLNSYYDGAVGVHKYTAAGVGANRFTSSAGTFAFYVAPTSVSGGDTITWTIGLYIDNSGNVSIGSPATIENKLHLYSGTSTVSTTQLELEGAPNGYGAGINFSSRTSSGGTLVSMAKITADGESSWNTTASTQDAGLRFFTTLDGTLFERLRITSQGVISTTGQYVTTKANNTAEGGGQIYLNGATGNRIDFNTSGVNAPTFTTRSVGTRIVLYPDLSASTTDFAFGIESYTLWSSVPQNTHQFKWYAGTTNIATLSGTGVLTATTFSGALSGNATTATTANALATANNYQVNSLGVGTAASGTAGEIRALNDITAFYGLSDKRLKENISPLKNVLSKLKNINGYNFNYKARPNQKMVGVIAQELIEEYPELIYETAPLDKGTGLKKVYAVRYELLTSILLQAIKELSYRISKLENE